MLAAVGHVAVLEQAVEVGAEGGDGRVQPLELARHVVGDDIGDDHARLVQHHVAERDAVATARRPKSCIAWRATGSAPGRAIEDSSPEAIISASTIAVVCSASSSSSV